jgi:DNA invertase Pin-like site-specific DNA recombinase
MNPRRVRRRFHNQSINGIGHGPGATRARAPWPTSLGDVMKATQPSPRTNSERPASWGSGAGLRVVAYYRMSSDEQTASIEQQRKECRAHAARQKWRIVREYEDAGRSGSKDIHKRVEFHRLIRDSAAGEWNAVLVWDTSRFSRQDPLDAAEAKRSLRANGVHLESVSEGRIDWATPMGRMMDYMRSEQNHDYSVKLGSSSVRGRMDVVRQGFWPHGNVPYGYARQYWADGKPVATCPRGQRPSRASGWKLKLVPNEPEATAVRWLFQQFAARDVSQRQMALEMSQRGVPLPQCGRGTWNKDVVKDILMHPVYCGDTPLGHHRRIWSYKPFNRCERVIMPDTHPAIIDRETWQVCQVKLAKVRETGRRVHRNKSSPLSGVIVCGHCGYRMAKIVRAGYAYFRCQSATTRPGLGCRQWAAREDKLIRIIRRDLVQAIDVEMLRTIRAKPERRDPAELDALKAQAMELERRIARGAENLLLADQAIFPQMRATLQSWEAELDRVRNTLKLAESEARGDEHKAMLKWWKENKETLIHLADAECIDVTDDDQAVERDTAPCLMRSNGRRTEYVRPELKADRVVLRSLLHRLNARVILHWTPNGKRYYKIDYGRLKAEFTWPENSSAGSNCTTTAFSSPRAARGASCNRG